MSLANELLQRLAERPALVVQRGSITAVQGTSVRALLPHARVGDLCRVDVGAADRVLAEVIGFDAGGAVLMPLGRLDRLPAGAAVECSGESATVPCGDAVRGRVLDAMGEPLDGKGPIRGAERAALEAAPPDALLRRPIAEPLTTGVRAIDAVVPVAVGQRVGIFAGAGVGKSTLLGAIARNAEVDTIVVGLIGERGREVGDFVNGCLGPVAMQRATVVVSQSDEVPQRRVRAALAATAIAEHERRRGRRVLLLLDSVTRYARAVRDVALAAGEAPGRQGFPSQVYVRLPQLFERAGNDDRGSITAFYTVLVAGDDLREPVADETMSLLDGHFVLDRSIAERGRYPAIDIGQSQSRLLHAIASQEQLQAIAQVRRAAALYEQNRDKIQMGLYDPESPAERRMVACHPRIEAFLQQDVVQRVDRAASIGELQRLAGELRG